MLPNLAKSKLSRGGIVRGTFEEPLLLNERAKRYRWRALEEDDPDRAALFFELAETLEREAEFMERSVEIARHAAAIGTRLRR